MSMHRLNGFGMSVTLAVTVAAAPPGATSELPPITLSTPALLAGETAAGQSGRRGAVRIDASVLAAMQDGRRVILNLLEGKSLAGVVKERRDRSPHRFTVSGSLDGIPGGSFLLAVNRNTVAGIILGRNGDVLRIRSGPDGLHVVERMDTGFACLAGPQGLKAPRVPAPVAAGACDDGSVIDVLVVYTQDALNQAGSVPAIEAEIDLSVEWNNQAYDDSLIASSWNLVYARQLGPDENAGLAELQDPKDGIVDGVHALRDAYGADVVALIRDGNGGVAYGILTLDPAHEAYAFSENGLGTFPLVMAHEIGHNLGCCHALGDGGGCPPEGGLLFPFSNGHRFTGVSGQLWHTIMAYTPGALIQRFSNPSVLFDGQPTGVPEGEPGAADNATTINVSRVLVANYRCNDGICESLGLPGDSEDCTGNGVPDACDLALGTSHDINGNQVPDECECLADLDGSGDVGISDFLALLAAWGTDPGGPPDINADGVVGIIDFLELLATWGPCP